MNLSDDPDYDLTFEWWAKEKMEEELSAHMEEETKMLKNNPFLKIVPKENKQVEKEKPVVELEKKSPITKILNWYKNSKVKPYVNARDFNSQGRDEFILEDNESQPGVKIGLKVDF